MGATTPFCPCPPTRLSSAGWPPRSPGRPQPGTVLAAMAKPALGWGRGGWWWAPTRQAGLGDSGAGKGGQGWQGRGLQGVGVQGREMQGHAGAAVQGRGMQGLEGRQRGEGLGLPFWEAVLGGAPAPRGPQLQVSPVYGGQ